MTRWRRDGHARASRRLRSVVSAAVEKIVSTARGASRGEVLGAEAADGDDVHAGEVAEAARLVRARW